MLYFVIRDKKHVDASLQIGSLIVAGAASLLIVWEHRPPNELKTEMEAPSELVADSSWSTFGRIKLRFFAVCRIRYTVPRSAPCWPSVSAAPWRSCRCPPRPLSLPCPAWCRWRWSSLCVPPPRCSRKTWQKQNYFSSKCENSSTSMTPVIRFLYVQLVLKGQ